MFSLFATAFNQSGHFPMALVHSSRHRRSRTKFTDRTENLNFLLKRVVKQVNNLRQASRVCSDFEG